MFLDQTPVAILVAIFVAGKSARAFSAARRDRPAGAPGVRARGQAVIRDLRIAFSSIATIWAAIFAAVIVFGVLSK